MQTSTPFTGKLFRGVSSVLEAGVQELYEVMSPRTLGGVSKTGLVRGRS